MIKGYHHTKKARTKISEANIDHIIPKDILYKLYIEEKKPTLQISKIYNCHDTTIWRRLKKYNIPIWEKGTFLKGIEFDEEHKNNISKAKKGKPTFNQFKIGHLPTKGTKGMQFSIETKIKMSEAHKGEKCYLWKGGITSLYIQIRRTFKYRLWRSDIFTRDDFTCQECGQCGGKLEVHHIKSFSSIIQKYEITKIEEALNCEELFNINNGITYCKKCHRIITNNNWKRNIDGSII